MTPTNNALPELPKLLDMHGNNNALCDFSRRWRVDGDYIRCGACDRPQLTSYADREFPHAEWCHDKNSPNMERHPWRTYAELLAPLCRASAGREAVAMRIVLPRGSASPWDCYDAERVANLTANGWTVQVAYDCPTAPELPKQGEGGSVGNGGEVSVPYKLLDELQLLSEGVLPDGDGVDVSVGLWAERWVRALAKKAEGA